MSLFIPCLLTVLIETGFFAIVGYREWRFLALCACVNAATNLTLNLSLAMLPFPTYLIYLVELIIVAVEYVAYALALDRGRRLFLLTFAANAISFLVGLLIYGPVR